MPAANSSSRGTIRQLAIGFLAGETFSHHEHLAEQRLEAVTAANSREFDYWEEFNLRLVRTAGLEPAQHFCRGILSPLCLPIPPRPHVFQTPISLSNEVTATLIPSLSAVN